jgi:mono/diheme cytochrome c family protein
MLKLLAVLITVGLFVFACTQNQPTNSGVANNTPANTVTNAATTPATAASPADELAEARRIFSTICVKCHKEDGKGGVTDIEGKKVKAPDFTTERMKKESDEEFIEVIKNGEQGEGMPAFKDRISEAEIKNLVKLIRREFQGKQ